MKLRSPYYRSLACVALTGVTLLSVAGCCNDCWYMKHKWSVMSPIPCPPPPTPLGQSVQSIMAQQESNGEALDFVVYEHEFETDSYRLTASGENHVRQIAARARETSWTVIVEESSMSKKDGTQFEYPVHNNPELDSQRRSLVSQALGMLGVNNADSRVVVAPAPVSPAYQVEAEAAFVRAFSGQIRGGQGSGGGGGAGGGAGGGLGGGLGGGGGGGF